MATIWVTLEASHTSICVSRAKSQWITRLHLKCKRLSPNSERDDGSVATSLNQWKEYFLSVAVTGCQWRGDYFNGEVTTSMEMIALPHRRRETIASRYFLTHHHNVCTRTTRAWRWSGKIFILTLFMYWLAPPYLLYFLCRSLCCSPCVCSRDNEDTCRSDKEERLLFSPSSLPFSSFLLPPPQSSFLLYL